MHAHYLIVRVAARSSWWWEPTPPHGGGGGVKDEHNSGLLTKWTLAWTQEAEASSRVPSMAGLSLLRLLFASWQTWVFPEHRFRGRR